LLYGPNGLLQLNPDGGTTSTLDAPGIGGGGMTGTTGTGASSRHHGNHMQQQQHMMIAASMSGTMVSSSPPAAISATGMRHRFVEDADDEDDDGVCMRDAVFRSSSRGVTVGHPAFPLPLGRRRYSSRSDVDSAEEDKDAVCVGE